ncbi:hypothetical protein [Flavobacterium alkalisoli]|uniref:hypothetical protein n=1 Tax=Flavobacterium alkalisoli TaxID=2602769 RepID=UPI003A91B774
MKKLLLLSLLTLVACGDKQGKTGENTVIDTLYLPDSGKGTLKKVITVKDTSRYSEKFIEDFKKDDYLYDVTLIDSCLVTNGDSIQIPLDLKLNREYLLQKVLI